MSHSAVGVVIDTGREVAAAQISTVGINDPGLCRVIDRAGQLQDPEPGRVRQTLARAA